ncbi:MAG: glycosyltransferase family 2 protein [Spirosomataceae bacterium]
MYHPEVTILLPVYNGAATLARAIQSILNQTYPHWQLLLIEDGSDDDSLSVAQQFADKRIRIISDGQHLGLVARLNQGIRLSESLYIARMDADDVSHPERLQQQIAFLKAHPDVDLAGTAVRGINKQSRTTSRHVFPVSHSEITALPWIKTISIAHPTWCGRTVWFQQWQYRNFSRNEDQELLLRAHPNSTYANLPMVLLDYYEDSSLTKKLTARWGWAKVLWDYYGKRGCFFPFFAGISVTAAKFFRDILNYIIYKTNIFG